jgi:hypothetical protein
MNIIDTRDLNTKLEEMEETVEYMISLKEEINDAIEQEVIIELQEEYNDLKEDFDNEEYNELLNMKDEITEWENGVTLISEDSFVDYVMEMLVDIGDLPRDIPWYIDIDEEKTAENIRVDYSCIEYQGIEYLFFNY